MCFFLVYTDQPTSIYLMEDGWTDHMVGIYLGRMRDYHAAGLLFPSRRLRTVGVDVTDPLVSIYIF